jgi:LysR family carnitine catabolism transcriptional activator
LISTPRGTAMRTLLDEQLEAAGAAPEVAIETAHVASVIPLVLVGAGVAILPEGMAAEAAAKGARVVRLDPPTRASVSLVWRPDRLSATAEHFLMLAADLGANRDT